MATHSFLFAQEGKLIAAQAAIRELVEAAHEETKVLTGNKPVRASDVQVYPQNRDQWGTVYLNATALRNSLEGLLNTLRHEFG
jgi:hypothetical protein